MTEVRESLNDFVIEGILKEKNLAKKVIDNKNVITGTVTVITGENQEQIVQFYASEFTADSYKSNDKVKNKSYEGLETVMEEYVSKVEAEQNDRVPDVVHMNVTLDLNEYYTPTGEYRCFPINRASFISRVKGRDVDSKAEGTIECYIKRIGREVVKDEDTGRLKVDVYVFMYGGAVKPFTFFVPKFLANDFERIFETDKTAILNIRMVNIAERRVEKIGGGFGEAREKITTTFKHELEVFSGEDEVYDEDTDSPIPVVIKGKEKRKAKGYAKATVKAALVQRQTVLDEMLEKTKNKNGNGGRNTSKTVNANDSVDF